MPRSRDRSWGDSYDSRDSAWPPYVPVAERRKLAEQAAVALRQKGRPVFPVVLEGRTIASTFWGKAWCGNLEAYSDYANRLPRGRSYVRSGAVVHLEVSDGKVEAKVSGTRMYTVTITIAGLARARWSAVKDECAGQVTSLLALLSGKLPASVMAVVTCRKRGIFPAPREIALSCSCPDGASMCKHVAAALYGVGARLDAQPELLFQLRGVDPAHLVTSSVRRATTKGAAARAPEVADDALGAIFGIDIDDGPPRKAPAAKAPRARARKAVTTAPAPAAKATRSRKRPVG